MASPQLQSLPPELQGSVVSWLFRPSDLKSLILACKVLRDVVTPVLYRSITIDVDQADAQALRNLLLSGHGGHEHLRQLTVYAIALENQKAAVRFVKDVLTVPPENCLSKFHWNLHWRSTVDREIVTLLFTRQRNIADLRLGPLDKDALDLPECPSACPLPLTYLKLPKRAGSAKDLHLYRDLIAGSKCSLSHLAIETYAEGFVENGSDGEVVVSSADYSRSVFETLFKHEMPSRSMQPTVLRGLYLGYQDFNHTGTEWVSAIDFSQLETLELWFCIDSDGLVTRLLPIFRTDSPKLHGLSYSSLLDGLPRVQELLRTWTGLQTLNLNFRKRNPHTKFDVQCLQSHKCTLRDLYLGLGTYLDHLLEAKRSCVSNQDLQWLCTNLVELRQVGIAMPELTWQQAESECWGLFGTAIAHLATLKKLTTLRLITWPFVQTVELATANISSEELGQELETWITHLDALATMIVRRIETRRQDSHEAHDGLSVLSFGSSYRNTIKWADGTQGSVCSPVYYKVRREVSESGHVQLWAKRLSEFGMAYEEPMEATLCDNMDRGRNGRAYETWG